MKTKQRILEAADLTAYKKLINILGAYTDKFPGTAVDTMFNQAVSSGKKIMPKDKHALSIVKHVLCSDTAPAVVQKLLNSRFSDLPISVRPKYKDSRRVAVAFWNMDGTLSDKVSSLIVFDGTAKGFWSDADGNKVTILDTRKAKESIETDEPDLPEMKLKDVKDDELESEDPKLPEKPDSVMSTKEDDKRVGIELHGDIDDANESKKNVSEALADDEYVQTVKATLYGGKFKNMENLPVDFDVDVYFRVVFVHRNWGVAGITVTVSKPIEFEVVDDDYNVVENIVIEPEDVDMTWVEGDGITADELTITHDDTGVRSNIDLTMSYIVPT